MNRQEYNQLLAERSVLEQMIAETPVEEAIDLRSLQSRKEEVLARIAEHTADEREPIKARLTFRGRPVVGSYGIFADFGMAATKAFTDAVSMLAASYDGPLQQVGPIPNRRNNQLLITSTATGSFGFELEEYREDALLLDDHSSIGFALDQTSEILQCAAVGSDDELTEAASGEDERVLDAVRNFLKKLMDNDAVCGFVVKDKAFSFKDVGEVRRSWERLGRENLHEQLQLLTGRFEGALPKRRTFEFQVADTSEIISGKIGPSVENPSTINHHLYQSTQINVTATRIGQGRPRYVLNSLPAWTANLNP